MNNITNKQRIQYGEKVLKKIRTYYPMISGTRASNYSVAEAQEPLVDKLYSRVNCQRARIYKLGGKTENIDDYKSNLNRTKPDEMYGNCGEFADLARIIAEINKEPDMNCCIATLTQNQYGHNMPIDHGFLIITNDSVKSNIQNIQKNSSIYTKKDKILKELNNRDSSQIVVVDPWADMVANLQQAKEKYLSHFSKALEIPNDVDTKHLKLNIDDDFFEALQAKKIKNKYPHLDFNHKDVAQLGTAKPVESSSKKGINIVS